MKALVTGDRGFLGRHFRAELEARDWEVFGCDLAGAVPVDCRDTFRLWEREMYGHMDLVVHCAAVVGGRAVIDGSPLETAVNLELDAAMFRWAARAKPGRVLYISSSAAYPVAYQGPPTSDGVALVESDLDLARVKEPDQVYGWSKVVGEVLAGRLREAGVPVTVVRPFSGYGADQGTDYPFPAILGRAARREDPLALWCGDCTRDFIHVSDVVKGALAVADSGTEDPVNLCTGRPTSFLELAAMAADACGYSPEIRPDPGAPSGVAYRVGYPVRMLEYYTPEVSLERGVRMTLEAWA